MRRALIPLLALIFAACGGTQSSSQFGDVKLLLEAPFGADEAGIYFATYRAYDEGEGVELQVSTEGDADFLVTDAPPQGCTAVMAIVPPAKLVLCVDEVVLQDDRAKVVAVVRALQRGYEQAQKEPEEALSAITQQVPDADADALAAELDEAAPAWTAGQPYFGAIERGPGRDSSVAREAHDAASG